ncbi:hypothetical protein CO678_15910 [Bradyrhizobium diazoefficiens]|uniref:hypothetical protein n=1 Tax=Bradyrhizobium diazoefficiens TaxID=1355477 RepID=UPI000BE9F10A|nr:hypothetical protein [Bradyrhizobium diazoefficiens]PDT60516.1 hypothetical protein CO678_15910 [Bradyrhizobium diazoefficiens]
MNGLANWPRLINWLGICFVVAFLGKLWWAQTKIDPPPLEVSWKFVHALYATFVPLSEAAAGALAITGAVFWLFTTWGWRQPIFRKLGVINFPDFSGTWYAIQRPATWCSFTTVVAVDHSFRRLRMTLIRNQSTGQTLASALRRTDTGSARIYVTYYSTFAVERALTVIPAVDHGEDHSGALFLDLNDESVHPEGWVLRGQYWTNKRRAPNDDTTKGTWGRVEMRFQRRDPAPAAVGQLCPKDQAWLTEPQP